MLRFSLTFPIVHSVNGIVNGSMKLFLLLTQSGHVRSPQLLTESEIQGLAETSGHEIDCLEVEVPWVREPRAKNTGGRNVSPYPADVRSDITAIRVPMRDRWEVKKFAEWYANQKSKQG